MKRTFAQRSAVERPELSDLAGTRIAAFFDREAGSWDAVHGPASGRAGEFRARASYLCSLCDRLGQPSVIDLGCGTGHQLIDLTSHIEFGIGLDISPAMITKAQCNADRLGVDAKIFFRVGDTVSATRDYLGRFRLALFVGSLEHAPDQGGQLAAAAGLLERDGRLVVIMPHPCNPGVMWSRWFGPRFDVPLNHLTLRVLTRLALAAGLRLEACEALPYGGSGVLLRRSAIVAGAYAACFALA